MEAMPHTTQHHVPQFTLGDRLAKARKYAGLSVDQMAERLGTSRNTIGNYEHERVEVRRNIILSYHVITQVPLEWLEDGTDPSDNGGDTIGYRISPGRRRRRGPPGRVCGLNLVT